MVPLENESAATAFTEELLQKGVIVRPLGAFGLPHCVRISTGTDEDNRMLIEEIKGAHLYARSH
jgi:histidinol-phosphate aminotransferase